MQLFPISPTFLIFVSFLEENTTNENYMSLPESTHTLLVTEAILSVSFLFAVGIACISAACLLLVLLNELSKGQKGNLLNIPGGVGTGVRGAQFCGECEMMR